MHLSPCSALITLSKAVLAGFCRPGLRSAGFVDVADGHDKLSFT